MSSSRAPRWQLPNPFMALAPGQTHLWQVHCPPTPLNPHQCAAWLTPDEQARSARLATSELQRRYLQAHLLLHQLLNAYCGVAMQACVLAYAEYGKPYLVTPQLAPPLEFNLSHAGDALVMAVGRGFAVGVDVERVRALDDLCGMIRATCSAREQAYLAKLATPARLTAFYRLWARKEAVLKLWGEGIGDSVSTLDVLDNPAGVQLLELAFSDPRPEGERGQGRAHYVGALARPAAIDPSMQTFHAVWQ